MVMTIKSKLRFRSCKIKNGTFLLNHPPCIKVDEVGHMEPIRLIRPLSCFFLLQWAFHLCDVGHTASEMFVDQVLLKLHGLESLIIQTLD